MTYMLNRDQNDIKEEPNNKLTPTSRHRVNKQLHSHTLSLSFSYMKPDFTNENI